MKIDLSGKTALVTGSTAGIGYAIAARFLQSGAKVALWDIAGAEPGPQRNITRVLIAQQPRHITELGLGLPRDPFLK